jgi:hypothetical protein
VLLNATKATFTTIVFIPINANKVNSIDNTWWLSIHIYVIQSPKRIHVLFCVDQINVSSTSNNIFALMFKCLLESSGLGFKELGRKLVSMGCDDSSVLNVIESVRPNNSKKR